MRSITQRVLVESTAIKSDCGNHRFVLSRIWNSAGPIGAFLCANPSKADQLRNDETVFKCGNMAANWGWGGFHVLNLYSNYSTDPTKVVRHSVADDLNEKFVKDMLNNVSLVVVACGNGHAQRLLELTRDVPLSKQFCLRKNVGGGYLHPARVDPSDFPSPTPLDSARA